MCEELMVPELGRPVGLFQDKEGEEGGGADREISREIGTEDVKI
jgi:hypothetical protein